MSKPPTPPADRPHLQETPPSEFNTTIRREANSAAFDPDRTFPPEAEHLLNHLKLGLENTDFELSRDGNYPTVPGFVILEELDRGGMGVVYRARQLALNRVVALKMIGGSRERSSAEYIRFLAEAEAMAAIRHPNVVEVYESGQLPSGDEGGSPRPYYAMEFVGGGSLAARLELHGAFAPREAAALALEIARGVHAAHLVGIIHRDIKPGNILLSNTVSDERAESTPRPGRTLPGRVQPKMTDFGLAKRVSSDMTRTHAVMGTPAYMSPEQASGKARLAGPAADIYAIGAVLYECLTGKPPFEAEDSWALLQRVMSETPVSPRSAVKDLNRDLELICLKCLRKAPAERYASAEELARDLEAFLAGRPVMARPIPAPVRAYRWAQRRPTVALLAMFVICILLIAPPLYVRYRGRLDTERAVASEASKSEAAAKLAQLEAENLADTKMKLADEATKAQQAAEELAQGQKLFALENATQRRAIDRPTGWTWDNRADLIAAAKLTTSPEARLGLRSTAASTLLAPDMRPVEPVARGFTGTRLAAADTPDGRVLAIGEFKAWGLLGQFSCTILLVDIASGRTIRKLTFPASSVSNNGPAQDGVRSLAFSHDGTKLFVGSRSSRLFYYDLTQRNLSQPTRSWNLQLKSIEQIAVEPDGRHVFALSPFAKVLRRFDIETGESPEWISTESSGFRAIAIDPEANDLIVVDGDTLERWNLSTREKRGPGKLFDPHYPHAFALAPGARVLLATTLDQLLVLDPLSFEEGVRFQDQDLGRSTHEAQLRHIAVHPSCMFVASAAH